MDNVNLFKCKIASHYFNQMTWGIAIKLDMKPETEEGRHKLHFIDAILGFESNPFLVKNQENVIAFLQNTHQRLANDGYSLTIDETVNFYATVVNACKNEIQTWRNLQVIANNDGLDYINSFVIEKQWEKIPDNKGRDYID